MEKTSWIFYPGGPPIDGLTIDIKHGLDPTYQSILNTPILKQTQQTKNEIDKIYTEGVWDDYKKITNPYEYIFISLSRKTNRSVACRTPLSRSYFKMLEILKNALLLDEVKTLIERDKGLYTSHAAEGPGGFIEAIHTLMPAKYSQAMTLRSTTKNIPGWRKTLQFLNNHPEICITYGEDETGDLLKIENIDSFIRHYPETKAHIYTADGGFDFSSDFNAQEETILPLLTAEFYLGLLSIKQGGVIVIKIFDTILRPTLELLWLITQCFREWSIVKPCTSRSGNAERYFIGKGYLGMPVEIDLLLRTSVKLYASGQTIHSFLKEKLPIKWLQTILTIQETIGSRETEVIQKTIEMIKNPNRNTIKKSIEHNVALSIEWCKKYNEQVNAFWFDKELAAKTIQDEINDLKHIHKSESMDWRGLPEVLQTYSQEQIQQRLKHHAATFARSRSIRVEKSSFRAKQQHQPFGAGQEE